MSRRKPPPPALPEPPSHLDEPARVKFQELAALVDVTQPGIGDAAAAYATAFSRWQAAEAQVTTLGAVIRSPAGIAVPNPYVAIAAQASRQMRQWGKELGIVTRPAKVDPVDEELARLMAQDTPR